MSTDHEVSVSVVKATGTASAIRSVYMCGRVSACSQSSNEYRNSGNFSVIKKYKYAFVEQEYYLKIAYRHNVEQCQSKNRLQHDFLFKMATTYTNINKLVASGEVNLTSI